ncbi:MAG: PhoPQ-activated pathogenicity-like protein PqaA type, partial [Verrucomicrobiales bacterium]|nr:PhoPQ-activated pathogenicity-like protein PqaA type [Verrucomicrobiales bacterium]
CEVTQISLVSQVWQGIKWEHDLVIFRPKDAKPGDKMLLLNSGGKAGGKEIPYGLLLTSKIKAPCAILLGIPNQPLFEGKKEDNLIAETFVRFLDTKDENWPLLFPMAKSLVKAMDALQEVTRKEWQQETKGFIVTGASKRGWTTWLTAASDPRVCAIAPMVIDTLNFDRQLPHQKEAFGGYSDQIKPYTERGLVPLPNTETARKLWRMVDPFVYRDRYTMPKLVVCGNNDRYWSTDALNLYWDDLPGPKWISYSPNAGHSLEEKSADGSKSAMRAVNNVCAFVRHQILGTAMPEISWKHEDADGKCRLSVHGSPGAVSAQVWQASAPSRDFREARWASRKEEIKDGTVSVTVEHPATGFTAFYADIGYQIEDIPYFLCTQLRLASHSPDAP